MTDQFDPAWPHGHQTRDGREVVIYRVYEDDNPYPVHGAYRQRDGLWESECWAADGRLSLPRSRRNPIDIINKPAPPRRRSGFAERRHQQ